MGRPPKKRPQPTPKTPLEAYLRAIEANARQFVPAANRGWEERFPGLFRVTDGTLEAGVLTGPGLGAVPPA